MFKKERRTIKGLKTSVVISFVLLAAFITLFVLYAAFVGNAGDADLKDFGAVMKYHVSGFKGLFTFQFHEASNVIYHGLSSLMYGLIILWLIFLFVGIAVATKKKRAIVAIGLVLTALIIPVYMFGATGLPKFWLMINNRPPFKDKDTVSIFGYVILIVAALYALFSILTYFGCILDAFINSAQEKQVTNEGAKEEQPAPEEEPAIDNDEPVMFEEIEVEAEEVAPQFEEKKSEEKGLDKNELADLIRGIVRDEINRNAPIQNAGNSPLVVQYFGSSPIAQEIKEPQPQPVKKEKKEPVAEVEKEEEIQVHDKIVVEEPKTPEYKIVTPKKKEKPAPAPVIEEAPVEKNKIIRIPFQERMLNADDEMKKNYNELKNEILSYGVNSRVSNSGDAFRLHRKTYVKITIAGLSLKLYFALNPDDYKDSTIPVQDAGHKGIYEEIPLVFKVKSGLSMRRAKELIQTVMDKDGLEQGTIADTDWVEKLKEQQSDADEAQED